MVVLQVWFKMVPLNVFSKHSVYPDAQPHKRISTSVSVETDALQVLSWLLPWHQIPLAPCHAVK